MSLFLTNSYRNKAFGLVRFMEFRKQNFWRAEVSKISAIYVEKEALD